MTELHGDIWGPKGIEKDPVYTYRPLNASALIGTGSPGSSLNSREGVITSSAEKLPGSPRDAKRSGKASSLGSKERLDSPRDSVSTASTGGSATSTSTASPPATKSKKTGKVCLEQAGHRSSCLEVTPGPGSRRFPGRAWARGPLAPSDPRSDVLLCAFPFLCACVGQQMSKRSTASASTPMNNILQLLKTKVENMDGRRHSVSLPPHGTVEKIPQRLRKLSDPLWAHFQPSTSTLWQRRVVQVHVCSCPDLLHDHCFCAHTVRRAYSRDLFDCIDLHRRLSEATARKIFSQLLSAVAYLQSQVRAMAEPLAKRAWVGWGSRLGLDFGGSVWGAGGRAGGLMGVRPCPCF